VRKKAEPCFHEKSSIKTGRIFCLVQVQSNQSNPSAKNSHSSRSVPRPEPDEGRRPLNHKSLSARRTRPGTKQLVIFFSRIQQRLYGISRGGRCPLEHNRAEFARDHVRLGSCSVREDRSCQNGLLTSLLRRPPRWPRCPSCVRNQADFFCGKLNGITFPHSSGGIHFLAFLLKLSGMKN
jgi:hypothetical protein